MITDLGCFSQLPGIVRALGEQALLVCGRHSLRRSGVLDRALRDLQEAGVRATVYDAVQGEPTLDVVQAAVDQARQAQVEVIIGIGGGSAMDVGKATAVLCNKEGTVQEYHGGRPISEPGLACVCVPTTAGTGSEVTNNAVLTDAERGVKKSIRGVHVFPRVAIVDPELTLSLPPETTASSGADALCQAIEAFMAIGAQPATDALSAQAIRRIGRSLLRAYEEGSDVGARTDMLYGSLLAGMSMTNTRLGGAHGLAHPLGFHYHIPHGVVCGLLLPYVMEHSLEYASEKYAEVAQLLGADTQGMSPKEAAQQAVAAVRGLIRRIGIPDRLRVFGLQREHFPAIIAESLPSANVRNNAMPLEADDLQVILEHAL
ncbi:MAG: hypothetical protein AMJ93_08995 [Anaerolineae bacterium SM23_84]|nr:MAG: hypothetical protein AMJ93_08995 [Anaerolineae bacterium SM23_84]